MAQLSFIGDSIRSRVCTEASQLTWGWSGPLPSLTVMYGSSLDGSALRTQHEHMCDYAVKLIASTTAILSFLVCLLHLSKTIVAYRTVLLASY